MSVFFWIEMARSLDSDGLEMFEESFIHFQAIRIETPGHLDPIENRHRSRPGDCIQITFRKRGNPWFHRPTFTYKMFAEVEVKRTVRRQRTKPTANPRFQSSYQSGIRSRITMARTAHI